MTENRNCEESLVEEAREFMCGYRLAADMLHLQRYERKRAKGFEEDCACADILEGDEADWKARIQAVGKLLTGMKNGREKLLLYHHYVRGTRTRPRTRSSAGAPTPTCSTPTGSTTLFIRPPRTTLPRSNKKEAQLCRIRFL